MARENLVCREGSELDLEARIGLLEARACMEEGCGKHETVRGMPWAGKRGVKNMRVPTEMDVPLFDKMEKGLAGCVDMAMDVLHRARGLSGRLLNARPFGDGGESDMGQGLLPMSVSRIGSLQGILGEINEELRYMEEEIFGVGTEGKIG